MFIYSREVFIGATRCTINACKWLEYLLKLLAKRLIRLKLRNVPFLIDLYKITKKYEMRTQAPVDNTVNDLRYEIKFENCAKDKSNFFIKLENCFSFLNKNIFYSRRHFFYDS